jgi:glycosyltransferase involved in cell wall biosynthesis
MKVCVAISVRDGGRFVAPALESVLAQEAVDLEVRIYDNGSTDGSLAVAESYASDPRVHVAVNERDLGYYGSLNRALAETNARYFAPFAADDLMAPSNLAVKVALLEEFGAGFVHSRAQLIDEDGAELGIAGWGGLDPYIQAPKFFECVTPVNIISCQSVVARTSALRWIGGFDEDAWYCADWIAWMRLSLRLGVVSIDQPLISNRVHAGAATSTTARTGAFAGHVVKALETAVADEYFPRIWAPRVSDVRARLLVHTAEELERHGNLRASTGEAAYAYAAGALASTAVRDEATELHHRLVAAAGLKRPAVPFHLAARAPGDPVSAARVVDEAARLAADGLLASLVFAADDADVDEVAAILGPALDERKLEADLVTAPLADLLTPGRVVLAPGGSDDVRAAEAAGIPVIPYGTALAAFSILDAVPEAA